MSVADVRVDIDQGAVDAMFRDWSNDIGRYIADLTARTEVVARIAAPVSPRGSKYAPPGYLKTRIAAAHKHNPDGTILGLVGVPLRSGSRYPLPFVSNPSGRTRNANRVRGVVRHYGYRPAAAKFLSEALATVMSGRAV